MKIEKNEIFGIYRPPYRPLLDKFFRSLEAIIKKLGANNDQILAGDFNICGVSRSPLVDRYLDFMRTYNLMPHINKITRPNPLGNDSCIDHTWSNFGFSFQSGVFNDVIISDYKLCFSPNRVEHLETKNYVQRSF